MTRFGVLFVDGPLAGTERVVECDGRIPPTMLREIGHVYTSAPQTIPPPDGRWRYVIVWAGPRGVRSPA